MKKILLIFAMSIVLATPFRVMAQLTDHENVIFNAILGGVFNLIVQDGDIQTATFNTANDYNNGISETIGNPGIDPGFTTVQMEATGNWYLEIHSADFMPTGTATGSIPINNLGVWCEATGIHQFGVEVTCSHQSPATALGLGTSDVTLIDLGSTGSDSGGTADNEFVLHWLMGTKQGSMNPLSMFDQLSAGLFSQGTFTTTVVLTMVEIP